MNTTYHPRGRKVHGMQPEQHPLYAKWASMKQRCLNKESPSWANYGGRGITVCEEWMHFEKFALDMGFPPSSKHTLERIDNNRGYCKDNCRWATRSEQCLNRRVFKNNKTGYSGIEHRGSRFIARYSEGGVSYSLGRHSTLEDAIAYRNKFIDLLGKDKTAALKMCERRVRFDSTTKVKGITPHQKGGFLVRVTVKGVRVYIGWYKTLDEAIAAKKAANV